MTELSPDISAIARKNESFILQRLSEVGQTRVAELTGLSETMVSRMKDGQIKNVCLLVAACGLKVVSGDSMEIDQSELAALETLSKKWLEARSNKHWGKP